MKRTYTKKKKAEPILSEKVDTPLTPHYELTLTLGTQTYIGTGTTLLEALQAMPRPTKIVTKGILTLSNGTQTVERNFFGLQSKRLFYKIAQPLFAKQFSFLLK